MPVLTRFAVVIESGRTSRGKYTFCTSPALPTMVLVPITSAVEKKYQGRNPARKNTGKWRMPCLKMMSKTTV